MWFLARWLPKLQCLSVLFLGGNSLTITQICVRNLYIHIYVCISTICTNIIYYFSALQKMLPIFPPWDFRYCSKGMPEKRKISWGENGLKGLCTHNKNKCWAISQAGSSASRGTVPPFGGSPLGIGPSWAVVVGAALSCLSSFASCKPKLNIFFLSLCIINHNLVKIIVTIVSNDGSLTTVGLQRPGIPLECNLLCWVRGVCSLLQPRPSCRFTWIHCIKETWKCSHAWS